MPESRFEHIYGHKPVFSNFTPGRVNLIGEHTDYNGGMVLPTAIQLGITIELSPRDDKNINISSDKFAEQTDRTLTDKASGHWSDYVVGALIFANLAEIMNGGADLHIRSTLPFGAGISSSAAVTVGVLKIARTLAKSELSDTDIAVLARRVENEFIDMPCGIMDQMAVAIAHPGQALALDTETLDYELIDLPDDTHMAVIHSGTYRRLSEGRYKERKEECDAVKKRLGHNNICRMSDEEFENLKDMNTMLVRRARHCMTEHRRTLAAIGALRSANMQEFGRLMIESHTSMRDDFEISVPSLDSLVDDAVELGALGARMTGGGFGGCIVACVGKNHHEKWTHALLSKHPQAFKVC